MSAQDNLPAAWRAAGWRTGAYVGQGYDGGDLVELWRFNTDPQKYGLESHLYYVRVGEEPIKAKVGKLGYIVDMNDVRIERF